MRAAADQELGKTLTCQSGADHGRPMKFHVKCPGAVKLRGAEALDTLLPTL